jgi:glutamyl-tRNA synthetase
MPSTSKPRVRFAPSPTGYLHIGGVRTALFNWLWARKTGGAFVLRIEDTDQERNTPESRQIIFDSLKWLGLTWDEGPEVGGAHGPYTQMERLAIYKEHAERLIREKKAFRCYCTKEELEASRNEQKARDPKATLKYAGTCRDKADDPSKKHVVRFRAPESGSITYVDKVFGEVVTPNSAQQDFVLVRSDGVPLYNFGAVVDDVTMGITLVARGRDHMVNTPPQILIYEALGAPVPEFAHLPMMLAPSGEKLSKRHAAVGVNEYRDKGFAPHAVLNYLARFGWSHGDQEVFSLEELTQAFTWEACGRGDGKFDDKKFLAIQHEHMKSPKLVSDAEYAKRVRPFLKVPAENVDDAKLAHAIAAVRERGRTFVEAADMMDFFFRDEPIADAKAVEKFLVKAAAPNLEGLAGALRGVTEWTVAGIEAAMTAWLTAKQLQIKDVAQSARVALTGRSASPGLYEVLFVLGRDASLARLEKARAAAEASGR